MPSLLVTSLKLYFLLAFVYFVVLLLRFNQGLEPQVTGFDVSSLILRALLWPKEIFSYLGGKL